MNTTLQNVLDFHITFGQVVNEVPTLAISSEVKKLRHTLMTEEYKETLKGEADNDMFEKADGLCDLLYVLNGTIITHGMQNVWDALSVSYRFILENDCDALQFRLDDYLNHNDAGFILTLLKLDYWIDCKIKEFGLSSCFPLLFAEVQRANMSKTCRNLEIVEKTQAFYTEKGIETDFMQKGALFVVVRKEDNKALKSIEWSEPNFDDIFLTFGISA